MYQPPLINYVTLNSFDCQGTFLLHIQYVCFQKNRVFYNGKNKKYKLKDRINKCIRWLHFVRNEVSGEGFCIGNWMGEAVG